MIRDRIPEPWLHVLQKHQVVTKYVDLVYESYCSNRKKSKTDLTNCRFRIRRALNESNNYGVSYSFWYSFNSLELLTDAEREMWSKINDEIQKYKSCL